MVLRRLSKWVMRLLAPKFRILEHQNLGETWYSVKEWKWYWPVWVSWTYNFHDFVAITQFDSAYSARQAINYRLTKATNLSSKIVEEL